MSTQTNDIVIDNDVVEAIAKKLPAPATADEIAEKLAEKMTPQVEDKVVKKDIHETSGDEGKTDSKRSLKKGIESMPKELRLAKGITGAFNRDAQAIREYNDFSRKQWSEKSNYQNVTTAADGGALVPDPEFIAEIERLTDDYGVASVDATVRSTDRDSVTILSGTNEISFTSTSEATAVNAQKLTYAATTATLVKYIATLPVTSELVEDSAVNIWNDISTEVARARAKLFDQLVFTDSTYGLLYAPDSGESWKTQTVGSAVTDLDFDDLMNAKYKVVGSIRRRGKFYMHPTVWNYLRQKKAGDGTNSSAVYYAGSPLEGVTPSVDGSNVELVDVMPAYGEITANEPFAVFGDLSRVMLHVKRQLEMKTFDAGVVKDAGGSDFNLITQDAYAMRATLRCVPQTNFPAAFTVIGTGTVS